LGKVKQGRGIRDRWVSILFTKTFKRLVMMRFEMLVDRVARSIQFVSVWLELVGRINENQWLSGVSKSIWQIASVSARTSPQFDGQPFGRHVTLSKANRE
jgi:hypothetical protein